MKIQGEAEISARTGVPTYSVREEDRNVTWSITVHNLLQTTAWDKLDPETRAERLHRVAAMLPPTLKRNPSKAEAEAHAVAYNAALAEIDDPLDRLAAKHGGADWLELHAIVARNALRNFLGESWKAKVPSRRLHLYAQPTGGWLGWIEVNGRVEAWVGGDGEIIEDARIDYGEVDGRRVPAPWRGEATLPVPSSGAPFAEDAYQL